MTAINCRLDGINWQHIDYPEHTEYTNVGINVIGKSAYRYYQQSMMILIRSY